METVSSYNTTLNQATTSLNNINQTNNSPKELALFGDTKTTVAANYQTHYVACYKAKSEIRLELKEALRDFIKSQNFKTICYKFYALLSVVDREKLNSEEFISKFIDEAIGTFYNLNKKVKLHDTLKKLMSTQNSTTTSKKRSSTHISSTRSIANEFRFTLEELEPMKNMMHGIFSNLIMNEENLASVGLILFSPYLELNLLRKDERESKRYPLNLPYDKYLSISAISKYHKGINIPRSENKINSFLTDLLQHFSPNNNLLSEVASTKILKILNKQYSLANELNSRVPNLICFSVGFSVLSSILGTFISIIKNDSSYLWYSIVGGILIAMFLCFNHALVINKKFEIFDITKLEIENYFKQKDSRKNFIELIGKRIILPLIDVEFMTKERTPRKTIFPSHDEAIWFQSHTLEYNNSKDKNRSGKNNLKDAQIPINKTQTAYSDATPQINPDMVVVYGSLINEKFPSETIQYKDLKQVKGRSGNKYFIYWDKNFLSDKKHQMDIDILKGIFDKGEEIKAGKGYSGIKKLHNVFIGNMLFSHELKSLQTGSRIYGFIQPTEVGFVVIFCYFDSRGRLVGH